MTQARHVVELDDVTVTYRGAAAPALQGASLQVHPGEVLLVAGPSGCGKSTLLRLVNGLVPRSYRAEVTGRVLVAGRDAAGLPLRTLSLTVGTLLQDPAKQVVGHSVLAEIAFGLENRGVAPAEIRRRAGTVAERLGITALLARAPHELSGGQLQMVAFAGVLVLEPAVVVVDEPLANLDPDAADALLAALRGYVDGGGAAVLVEHRVDEALTVRPDRVLHLHDGRVGYHGDVPGFLAVADPTAVTLPFATLLERDDAPGDARPPAPAAVDADAPPRLRFDDADLGYGQRTVLGGVQLAVRPGECVAVLGPNGVGKSTLMRAAVGLVEPSRGRVLLDGVPAAEVPARELVATCGYLFQNPAQALFSETVQAELAFGPRHLGADDAEVAAVSAAALEAVGLADVPDVMTRPPRTLSFGQQRRLAVALALTSRPSTLVLDEPTAGQDARSASRLLDAVWELPGVDSVHLVTHDVDLALSRATRVVVVGADGIVADGTPAAVVADRSLWHAPGAGGAATEGAGRAAGRAVLRETDYVRAVREHAGAATPGPADGPADGRLPSALALAAAVRARAGRARRDLPAAAPQHP